MPSPQAPTGAETMAGLTSLRGIAAWLVVLFHLRVHMDLPLPGMLRLAVDHGYLAVDLFFMMSGFIMMHVHGLEFGTVTGRSVRAFLVKRLARIYPLHAAMLLLYVSVPLAHLTLGGGIDDEVAARFDGGAFVAQLLLVHAALSLGHSWNVPAWSIGVEWFAYLAFPAVAAAAQRMRGAAGDAAGFLLPLVLLAAVFRVQGLPSLDVLDATALWRGVLGFTAGVFLHRLYRRSPLLGLGVPLAALILLSAVMAADGPRDYYAMPCAAAALVVLAAWRRSPLARALSPRPLVYLGEISYSTYLIHFYLRDVFKLAFMDESLVMPPGLVLLYLGVVLAGSVAAYHLIELPCRTWLRGGRLPRPRFAT